MENEVEVGQETVTTATKRPAPTVETVQMESDERWKGNSYYYAKEISEVEKCLRMIRKKDFESINKCEACETYGVKQ